MIWIRRDYEKLQNIFTGMWKALILLCSYWCLCNYVDINNSRGIVIENVTIRLNWMYYTINLYKIWLYGSIPGLETRTYVALQTFCVSHQHTLTLKSRSNCHYPFMVFHIHIYINLLKCWVCVQVCVSSVFSCF